MILFIDCETNGLPIDWLAPIEDVDNWPRITELAWQLGEEMPRSELVRPDGWTVPEEVSRLNGITTEQLAENGTPIRHVLRWLSADLADADLVVAHNMSFDQAAIDCEMIRAGLPTRVGRCKTLCTKIASTAFCQLPGKYGYKWPKLEELHRKLFGCDPDPGAHRAAVDVETLMKCYRGLVENGVIEE